VVSESSSTDELGDNGLKNKGFKIGRAIMESQVHSMIAEETEI